MIGELTDEGMSFTAIVEICGEVYAETETQCVTDAFGPDREITMTSACVEGLKVTGAHCVKDKAEGTVTLPSGDNADKITAIVGFGLTSLTVYAEGGKAVAEGGGQVSPDPGKIPGGLMPGDGGQKKDGQGVDDGGGE